MRDDRERLTDILEAVDKIASRVARGREQFDVDEDLQIALIHFVQLIGEAAARISDDVQERHPTVPWRQVVGMRNRVVHGYFDIDLEILWSAASLDVPKLGRDIEGILAELPTGDQR